MVQIKERIGIREYIAIVLIMTSTKLTDNTPVLLFEPLYNAGWMAPVINSILSIIPIYLLIRVMGNYQEKNLLEISDRLFGKFLSTFLLLVFLLIAFSTLVVDTAIYTDIIGTMYFIRTPTIVIYGILLTVSAYGAKRGLEQIASVSWLVLPYLQVTLLFALILTIWDGNISFIFPIFGQSSWEVVKESALRQSILADFLYLFILYPYLKSKKDFSKGTWLALFFTTLNLTVSLVCFLLFFDYNTVMQLNYPYHEVIRTISLGFLTNMETFFLPFWLIASFVRFSIYLYIVAFLFGHIFKIKHYEYVTPSLATVIVFLGLIPESPSFTLFNYKDFIFILTSPVFFFFPILLYVVAMLKGEFKSAKKQKVG
ncbi:endospore germination permease [Ornithinibacillus sp. BX22]|uniref:Endospore germination permease n=1 Tax=Ornithinibacillus hominis TaxID=2763055 RepID=A0A923RG34_9BACI|nr:endospore germination permease [Ornithinibacillus hominis]MBC5635781.1 endospore germination permease [Ornithinibacillus hominis]